MPISPKAISVLKEVAKDARDILKLVTGLTLADKAKKLAEQGISCKTHEGDHDIPDGHVRVH